MHGPRRKRVVGLARQIRLVSAEKVGTRLPSSGEQSDRSSTDKVVQAFDSPYDEPVINAVQKLAEARGISMAKIALAWVLRNPLVTAPIVGATKPHHLPEAVEALALELTDEEAQELEAPYQQYGPSWF